MKVLYPLIGICIFLVAVNAQAPRNGEIVPFAKRLQNGFDSQKSVYMDLPIFKFNYKEAKTYSPPKHPEIVFSVPDEMQILEEQAQHEIVGEDIAISYTADLKSFTAGFNFGVDIKYKDIASLAFKYDHEMNHVHYEMNEKDRVSGFSKHWWEIASAETVPSFLLELDDIFVEGLKQLPKSISTDKDMEKYVEMIDHYGTHYVYYGSFGGLFHLRSFLDQDTFKSMDQKWTFNQISLTFHYLMFDISAGGFTNRSEIKIDNNFTEHSRTIIDWRGGDPSLQSNTTVREWVDSINTRPDFLNISLTPISDLLDSYPQVQKNWIKVVKFYQEHHCYPTDAKYTPCKAPTPSDFKHRMRRGREGKINHIPARKF